MRLGCAEWQLCNK